MRTPVLIVTCAVALASCAPQPPKTPPPAPVTRQAPAPPSPAVADWRDLPQTPGEWTYRRDARGSLALFGVPGGDAVLTLRCDLAAGRIYLSRAGAAATPLTIRTSSTTRVLSLQPTGGTPPYAAAALAATDPILDAMGFSRGRFAVEQAGGATLAVPAWAEVERVTQDCRG